MSTRFTLPLNVIKVLVVLFAVTAPVWAQSATASGRPTLPPELEKVRAALEKYQDPVAAIHDGYLSAVGCADFPYAPKPGHSPYPKGAMGVHFLNPALVAPTVDPMHPQILLYEPEAGGKLRLVGAEWFVPLATGVKEPPALFGQRFWGPMAGHEPLMPDSMAHYDLHVWLFKANPEGLFAPTNPAVKCDGYAYAEKMHSTRMVANPNSQAGQTASIPH